MFSLPYSWLLSCATTSFGSAGHRCRLTAIRFAVGAWSCRVDRLGDLYGDMLQVGFGRSSVAVADHARWRALFHVNACRELITLLYFGQCDYSY